MTDSIFRRPAESAFSSVWGAHQVVARVCARTCSDECYVAGNGSAPGTFYWIDAAACRVDAGNPRQSIDLTAGDLIVFPRGGRHRLVAMAGSAQGSPSDQPCVALLSGEFDCGGWHNPLIQGLPEFFVVPAQSEPTQIQSLGRMLAAELRKPQFGNQIVLRKLADSLLVLAIRSYLADHSPGYGLLAGIGDPRLAPALEVLHGDPGRNWSVLQLARLANLSRTSFCSRFSSVIGTTPMRYLTEWRMAEALRLLGDPALSVARIGERLGYKTEAAFRRAFRRTQGRAPGAVRREVRNAM